MMRWYPMPELDCGEDRRAHRARVERQRQPPHPALVRSRAWPGWMRLGAWPQGAAGTMVPARWAGMF